MFYYLDLTSRSNEITRYVFVIESENRQRWADMRLIQIQQLNSEGFSVTNYDPLIHTPTTSHYMSRPWKARWKKIWFDNDQGAYWLINPFGSPNTEICLAASTTIELLNYPL